MSFLQILPFFREAYIVQEEPGWLSRYSDWLRAGRPRESYSIPDMGKKFLPSVQRPDQFHVPPSSLSRVYWRTSHQEWSGRGVRPAAYLCIVPRLRTVELF
jgi:hypothetical protein